MSPAGQAYSTSIPTPSRRPRRRRMDVISRLGTAPRYFGNLRGPYATVGELRHIQALPFRRGQVRRDPCRHVQRLQPMPGSATRSPRSGIRSSDRSSMLPVRPARDSGGRSHHLLTPLSFSTWGGAICPQGPFRFSSGGRMLKLDACQGLCPARRCCCVCALCACTGLLPAPARICSPVVAPAQRGGYHHRHAAARSSALLRLRQDRNPHARSTSRRAAFCSRTASPRRR